MPARLPTVPHTARPPVPRLLRRLGRRPLWEGQGGGRQGRGDGSSGGFLKRRRSAGQEVWPACGQECQPLRQWIYPWHLHLQRRVPLSLCKVPTLTSKNQTQSPYAITFILQRGVAACPPQVILRLIPLTGDLAG